MNADREYRYSDLTNRVIGGFYDVYNALGYGFLEKVYENALARALGKRGLSAAQQAPIKVHYDGAIVGEYYADLLVSGVLIVELKACEGLTKEHEAQLLNYLKATDIDVGLLLNFGPKPEVRRRIYESARHHQ